VNGLIRIRAEIDLDAPVAAPAHCRGASLDNPSLFVEPHITMTEHGMVCSHQQVEDRQEQAVGTCPRNWLSICA